MRPIIMELRGGLGNQLFQYAALRATSYRLGSEPIIDLKLLNKDAKRRYVLSEFNVRATVVDSSDLPRPSHFLKALAVAGLRLGSLRAFPFEARLFIEDDTFGCWDPRVEKLQAPAVMHGYFQSERYFAHVSDIIRTDLKQKRTSTATFRQFSSQIHEAGVSSVSVHIRRGDYVSDPVTARFHGILGSDYYQSALEKVAAVAQQPRLFVFSDDPDAIAPLLGANHRICAVSGRGLSDFEELSLMSLCKHHVIANSSFSWWGAWLGAKGGLTIAPRRWFAAGGNEKIRDRFPGDWHILGCSE